MIMSSWTGYKKFNNGIKRYVKLLVLVLMLSVAFSAQADSSYISIQEMREAVPSTWTETLKGGKKNFDCTIDAAVVVPEVDQFPILVVDYQGIIPELEETGFYIEENTEQGLTAKSRPDDAVKDSGHPHLQTIHEESLTEETINLAEQRARQIFSKVWDMNGTELEKLGVAVHQDTDSDFNITEVDFCPVYEGIAYLTWPCPYYGIKGYIEQPHNQVYAFWESDEEYECAVIMIPKLVEEYLPDVPLLPFENIQEVIRQRIREGYIQSICEVRLGYICCNNPDQPGESFYLTPAWVVCGVMNSSSNLPFYPQNYSNEQRYSSSTTVINAQTGELIDFTSRSKETFDAHILTWEDVR